MQSALKICTRCQMSKYPHDFESSLKICKCCLYANKKPSELQILRKNDVLSVCSWRTK